MTTSPQPVSRSRTRLMAAAASVAIAGAIGLGAVTTGTAPVMAEAVRIEAPQAAPVSRRCPASKICRTTTR